MLSPQGLTAWYERLNLSLETRSVIDRVRSSEPTRPVGGGPPPREWALSKSEDGYDDPV